MRSPETCPSCERVLDPDPQTIAHIRTCPRCFRLVSELSATCSDPRLALQAARELGTFELSEEVRAHLERCLACALDRIAFDDLDLTAIDPDPEWARKVKDSFRTSHLEPKKSTNSEPIRRTRH